MSDPVAARPMTQRHLRAIRRLERALSAAHEAGIVLCGMDSSLYAYRADDFDRLSVDLPSAYEVQQALDEVAVTLKDGGAYRESGGW